MIVVLAIIALGIINGLLLFALENEFRIPRRDKVKFELYVIGMQLFYFLAVESLRLL